LGRDAVFWVTVPDVSKNCSDFMFSLAAVQDDMTLTTKGAGIAVHPNIGNCRLKTSLD